MKTGPPGPDAGRSPRVVGRGSEPGSLRKAPASGIRVGLRFFGELNDFLPAARRGRFFVYATPGRPAVKDMLEAVGVPHTETATVLAQGRAVALTYRPRTGDRIRVYPEPWRTRGRARRSLLRPHNRKTLKFVADCHLGKLARGLRLLGFDTIYQADFPDEQIVQAALRQKRVVLTRDIALLKRSLIRHGRWLRSSDPERQLREVLHRFAPRGPYRPFSRCLACNGRVMAVPARRVWSRLPPRTRRYFRRFHLCRACGRVYWKGSHYRALVEKVRSAIRMRSGSRGEGSASRDKGHCRRFQVASPQGVSGKEIDKPLSFRKIKPLK